jgi:hypothetical protein
VEDREEDMSLVQGRDYYIEKGKYVFTAHYLENRGFCCRSKFVIALMGLKRI